MLASAARKIGIVNRGSVEPSTASMRSRGDQRLDRGLVGGVAAGRHESLVLGGGSGLLGAGEVVVGEDDMGREMSGGRR